jgi:hypothetical protein
MLKIKRNKKLMIPVIAMILIVAMAGSALAYAPYPSVSSFPYTHERTRYDGYALFAQRIIYDYGWTNCTCDGYFGSTTKSRVEDYQRMKGFNLVDGKIGSQTWGAMKNDLYQLRTDGTNYIDYLGHENAYILGEYNDETIYHTNSDCTWWVLHQNGTHQGIN